LKNRIQRRLNHLTLAPPASKRVTKIFRVIATRRLIKKAEAVTLKIDFMSIRIKHLALLPRNFWRPMKLREVIFWLHLICAVVTAIVVFIMSITAVALTYLKQMTSCADQRLYRIQAPAGGVQLFPEILIEKLREAMPKANPSNLTLYPDPAKATSVDTGPNEMLFLNPYTGQAPGAGSTRMRKFLRVMTDWHRWLALSGEQRSIGKAVTGAFNLL
jgi:uncharacterized iron-regulated membrane protein